VNRLTLIIFVSLVALASGESADQADKVSRFAPAADLIQQAQFFQDRVAEAVAATSYGELEQTRVQKDAQTLAILYLCLARHDEKHDLSGVAAGRFTAARQIAENYKDQAKAKTHLDQLKSLPSSPAPASQPPEWQPVGDIPVQMKHSQFIENRMKRGLADERTFKRRAKETAGYVATLAAYGQVWRMMAPKEDAGGKWQKFSDVQRDAAGALNTAIHKQDWPTAREAAKKLTQSCNACHDVYRKSP
jgi:hypothetical protein